MYAIIATGGKQYKVAAGDKVRVEKLDAEVGSNVVINSVLLADNGSVKVGSPYIEGASVEAEVLNQGKGKKVIVYKYKAKKGYHKKNGHRQLYTELLINKIIVDGVEYVKEETAEEEPAAEAAEEITEETAEAAEETVEEAVEAAEETVEAAEAAGEEAAEETAE